jgi:hypothetical protein
MYEDLAAKLAIALTPRSAFVAMQFALSLIVRGLL